MSVMRHNTDTRWFCWLGRDDASVWQHMKMSCHWKLIGKKWKSNCAYTKKGVFSLEGTFNHHLQNKIFNPSCLLCWCCCSFSPVKYRDRFYPSVSLLINEAGKVFTATDWTSLVSNLGERCAFNYDESCTACVFFLLLLTTCPLQPGTYFIINVWKWL